jgi:hypothetical protein
MRRFLPIVWVMALPPVTWMLNLSSYLLAVMLWVSWRLFRGFNEQQLVRSTGQGLPGVERQQRLSQ